MSVPQSGRDFNPSAQFDAFAAGVDTETPEDSQPPLLTKKEAREIEGRIRFFRKDIKKQVADAVETGTRKIQFQLWKMDEGRGFKALDRKNFSDWAVSEFGGNPQHWGRQLRAVRVNIEVNGSFPILESDFAKYGKYTNGKEYIIESHCRELAALDQSQWKRCWEEIKSVAAAKTYPDEKLQRFHGGKVRMPDVKEVVSRYKLLSPATVAQDQDDESESANRAKAARFAGRSLVTNAGELGIQYQPSTGYILLYSDETLVGHLTPYDQCSVARTFAQTTSLSERISFMKAMQHDLGAK